MMSRSGDIRVVRAGCTPAPGRGRCALLAAAGAALLGAAGCGSDGGPTRYDLSGKVTYGSQPVPAGYIVFAPDTSQGNTGPGAQADIKDGRYQTPPGQGTVGGPHRLTISGFDGRAFQDGPVENPMGKPLFATYQLTADLPKESTSRDLQVPVGGKK
jgi:hypothetical protein